MSLRKSLQISLAFVGLLVGAGFATGQEVIQYFGSFGISGIWGAILSGIVMTVAGAVILQLGSYFLADEHNMVFQNVSHPIVSKILDLSVSITLFAVGFVMLAGAGANLEQQFGLPAWVGAAIMVALVMVTGLMDVDRVSRIISAVTPLIIIVVVFAFAYTMTHLPHDPAGVAAMAEQAESPVRPWWLSALNYNGLALILGVSMCLVIGGNNLNPREAGVGGLAGGIVYTVMLMMALISLLFNFDKIGDSDVPMLAVFDHIDDRLSLVMVWIIFAMIYNTCIGMFYALGRRFTANHKEYYRPVFLALCLAGFGVSFFGFGNLMTFVYPILGWIGMFLVLVLVAWWAKSRMRIKREVKTRERVAELVETFDENETLTDAESKELNKLVERSNIDNMDLVEAVVSESDDPEAEDDDDTPGDLTQNQQELLEGLIEEIDAEWADVSETSAAKAEAEQAAKANEADAESADAPDKQ